MAGVAIEGNCELFQACLSSLMSRAGILLWKWCLGPSPRDTEREGSFIFTNPRQVCSWYSCSDNFCRYSRPSCRRFHAEHSKSLSFAKCKRGHTICFACQYVWQIFLHSQWKRTSQASVVSFNSLRPVWKILIHLYADWWKILSLYCTECFLWISFRISWDHKNEICYSLSLSLSLFFSLDTNTKWPGRRDKQRKIKLRC